MAASHRVAFAVVTTRGLRDTPLARGHTRPRAGAATALQSGSNYSVARRSRAARSSCSPNSGAVFISRFTELPVERDQPARLAGDHGGRARAPEAAAPVERRQLAEELARAQPCQLTAVRLDPRRPQQHHVQVAPRLPLADHRLAGRRRTCSRSRSTTRAACSAPSDANSGIARRPSASTRGRLSHPASTAGSRSRPAAAGAAELDRQRRHQLERALDDRRARSSG